MRRGWLAPIALGLLGAACDPRPFEPFEDNPGAPFSMFGYLDLYADTQWIRVMPVRQELFLEPTPIDATVTLENLKTGRVVAMRDSLFAYRDEALDTTAYAHNFWTTERLEPKGSYRLKVTRSDGASSTATIPIPGEIELRLMGSPVETDVPIYDNGRLFVTAEHVVLVNAVYWLAGTCSGTGALPPRSFTHAVRQRATLATGIPGLFGFHPVASPLHLDDCDVDLERRELQVATAPASWPYDAKLTDIRVAAPNTSTSNVESGLGFVGGVAIRSIPFDRCDVLAARPGTALPCDVTFARNSPSIEGRIIPPCGVPSRVVEIRLREDFAGGGSILLAWKTGPRGEYRFEGLEAGAKLTLQIGARTPPIPVPVLSAGQRYVVSDVSVPEGC